MYGEGPLVQVAILECGLLLYHKLSAICHHVYLAYIQPHLEYMQHPYGHPINKDLSTHLRVARSLNQNWSSGYDLCFRHATCPLLPAEDTSWNCAYSIKLSMDIWTSLLHWLYHETCPDLSETPSPWKATNTRMPISHHFSCIQLHFISINLYKTASHCVLWNTVLCHTSNISRNTLTSLFLLLS